MYERSRKVLAQVATFCTSSQWLGPCAVLLAAGGWRSLGLFRSLYLDEYATFEVISASWAQSLALLRWDTVHPAYFLWLKLWAQISMSIPWLRLLSLLCDVLAVAALLYFPMRRGQNIWHVGLLVWFFHPLLMRFAIELRPYAALGCATLWAMGLTHLWYHEPVISKGRDGAALVVLWCGLLALHPVGIMVLVACLTSLWVCQFLALQAPVPMASSATVPLASSVLKSGLAQTMDVAQQRWRQTPMLSLWMLATPCCLWFAWLHWVVQLEHSGDRIRWIPVLSFALLQKLGQTLAGLDAYLWRVVPHHGPALLGDSGWPMAGGTILVVGSLWLWRRQPAARHWLMAAWIHASLVCLYSLWIQPIAWFRSLLPSLALGIGALSFMPLSFPRHRAGFRRSWRLVPALLLGLWLLVAAFDWLLGANRSLDPSTMIAKQAVAILQHPGTIAVFPHYLDITVAPHLPPHSGESSRISVVDLATTQQTEGVVIVRLEQEPLVQLTPLGQALFRLRQQTLGRLDFFVTMTDDDDRWPPARKLRQVGLDYLSEHFAPCHGVGLAEERVAHLTCVPQTRLGATL